MGNAEKITYSPRIPHMRVPYKGTVAWRQLQELVPYLIAEHRITFFVRRGNVVFFTILRSPRRLERAGEERYGRIATP
jgi:hypothetical protein